MSQSKKERPADVFAVVVAAAVVIVSYALARDLGVALARAGFPLADNLWSEGPLMLQVHRLAAGDAAYTSTLDVNSFTYGPLYLILLGWIGRLLHGAGDAAALRSASIAVSLLATVPVAASALFISRRAGIAARHYPAQIAVVAVAVLLGAVVMLRSLAFDAIHPDALLDLIVATMLAVYYALTIRLLPRRFVWVLVVLGMLAAFTELRAAPILPILAFGLIASRTIGVRVGSAAALSYAVAVLALSLSMTPAARAWTLLVPRSQPYDLSPRTIFGLWDYVRVWQPQLGGLALAVAAAIAFLWRRTGPRALIVDGPPLLAVLIAALAGYFQQSGDGHNLTLLGLLGVSYYAMLAGALVTWTATSPRQWAMGAACGALIVAIPLGLFAPMRDAPTPDQIAQVQRARVAVRDLCGRNAPILVTALPDLFFDCPTARYALYASFGQLVSAFPRYFVGSTALDTPPSERYVVALDFYGMPLPARGWLAHYRVVRKVPVPFGYASLFYWPSSMLIYERDPRLPQRAAVAPTNE